MCQYMFFCVTFSNIYTFEVLPWFFVEVLSVLTVYPCGVFLFNCKFREISYSTQISSFVRIYVDKNKKTGGYSPPVIIDIS